MAKKAAKKQASKSAGKPAAGKRPAKKQAAKKAAKGKGPSEAEMMAMWEKASKPGDHHRRLEPMAGTFATKTTFVMNAGDQPHVSDGVSEHRLVLGGRYLEQSYSGSAMGMPFEGIGYTGYDNVQGRYIGMWMDSFGTGMMPSHGIGKPSAKAIDFDSSAFECTGKKRKFLCKLRIQDHDHHTFEMWTNGPKGKSFRTMIIEYVRK